MCVCVLLHQNSERIIEWTTAKSISDRIDLPPNSHWDRFGSVYIGLGHMRIWKHCTYESYVSPTLLNSIFGVIPIHLTHSFIHSSSSNRTLASCFVVIHTLLGFDVDSFDSIGDWKTFPIVCVQRHLEICTKQWTLVFIWQWNLSYNCVLHYFPHCDWMILYTISF